MNRDKWLTCAKCDLHETRRNVVMGSGPVPADILLVGEAPGKAEDLRAEPFIGPSRRLFEYMVKCACEQMEVSEPTIYFTNVCACRPTTSLSGPNTKPTDEQVWACFPRLLAEARAVNPLRVLLVGKLAQKACAKAFRGAHKINHPAHLLRSGGPKSPYFMKEVRDLGVIFKEVMSAKETNQEVRKVRRLVGRSN